MKKPSSSARETSNSRIKIYTQTNYQEVRHLIKMVYLVKAKTAAQLARLPQHTVALKVYLIQCG